LWTTKNRVLLLPQVHQCLWCQKCSALGRSSKIRTGMSDTTTTWNSFGGRAGPPFRHFLHQLMSSEFSMSVRCVISSLPVDTIPVEGALASPSTLFNQRVIRSALAITICNLGGMIHDSNQGSRSLFRLLFANLPIHRPYLNRYLLPDSFRHFKDISIAPPGICSLLSPPAR
jgi:hypothetical protein